MFVCSLLTYKISYMASRNFSTHHKQRKPQVYLSNLLSKSNQVVFLQQISKEIHLAQLFS